MTDPYQVLDSYIRASRQVLHAPDRRAYYDALYMAVRKSVPELQGNWPSMTTTCSTQRRVELIRVQGEHHVVYDQAIGHSFEQLHRLLQFALDAKAGYALSLKHAAQFAHNAGHFGLASICAASHMRIRRTHPLFAKGVAEVNDRVSHSTECQEQYALTHEIAHLLYERDHLFRNTYRSLASAAMSRHLSKRKVTAAQDEAAWSRIANRWKSLYEPHLGAFGPQMTKAKTLQDEVWSLCETWLTEELACDLFAIERTVSSRLSAGFPSFETVAAAYLAFKCIRQLQLLDASSEFLVCSYDPTRVPKPRQAWIACSSFGCHSPKTPEGSFDADRGATMLASHLRESVVLNHLLEVLEAAAPGSSSWMGLALLDLADRFDELIELPAAFTLPSVLMPIAVKARQDERLPRCSDDLDADSIQAFEQVIGLAW